MEYPGELFLIDKPYKWTSFDVVGKLRWLLRFHYGKKIKVGHAGTLDPLASGLLIICTGKQTRSIDSYQALEKEYTGEFYIGASTASFDLETPPGEQKSTDHLTEEMIRRAAKELSGTYEQLPPLHSAKWIDGKRAYHFARAGREKELKRSLVTIAEFELTKIDLPLVAFRVVCSKGTYIRSLARDIGEKLGTGAYLHSLVRTRIGKFHLKDAISIEQLEAKLPARYTRDELE